MTHAISQWDLATGGLVTTKRLGAEACADYSEFVGEVVAKVQLYATTPEPPGRASPTNAEIEAYTTGVLDMFEERRIKSTRTMDIQLNEVLMIDYTVPDGVTRPAFTEISKEVGHGECESAIACALGNRATGTVDIILDAPDFNISNLNVPRSDDTADAGEIPFNTCGGVHERYGVVVHEAGHALGIGGGISGADQDKHHPHINDSTLSHDRDRALTCTPSPFDVMALYALYQGR